jgi:hypothetical protein
VRYVSVQRHAGSLHDDEQTQPAHLISLISAPYASTLRWNGIGTAPTRFRLALDQLVKDAHAVEGRRLRIYHVPRRASIYRQLAAAGVDLISTQAPAASLRTLENQ